MGRTKLKPVQSRILDLMNEIYEDGDNGTEHLRRTVEKKLHLNSGVIPILLDSGLIEKENRTYYWTTKQIVPTLSKATEIKDWLNEILRTKKKNNATNK